MDPRGTVGRIYIEEHYTLLQTKYESSGPCGFGEEDFFYVFLIFDPRGHSFYATLFLMTHDAAHQHFRRQYLHSDPHEISPGQI